MIKEKEALNALVLAFNRDFLFLENSLANLLNEVLFCKTREDSRIAHAIYFTPDSFRPRQILVNNAVKEWLIENPIGQYDFISLWAGVNDRLNSLRAIRNDLAHGSVQAFIIRDVIYVRVFPPTFTPKLADKIATGAIPGRSHGEIERGIGGITAAILCVDNMARALQYHDEEEPTWKETYDALAEHLNRLNSWFPDALKTREC